MDQKALGFHFLIELKNCANDELGNPEIVEKVMHEAVNISGATEIGAIFHRFSPHGASGVILISESHFSIHTWPEMKYAAVDLFTCNESLKIQETYEFLVKVFGSADPSFQKVKRGIHSA